MSELKASVRLDFRDPLGEAPFDLVQDQADAREGRGAFYALKARHGFGDPGLHEEQAPLLAYGFATVRLYGPAGPVPEVLSLDPPSEPEPEEQSFRLAGMLFFVPPNGYDGQQIVYLGRREAEQVEALEFSGSNEARIRYWHDSPNIEVLHQSDFINPAGEPATPPALHPGGRFVAAEPVSGGLLVRYTTSYGAWRVYYDVPTHRVRWLVSENGRQLTGLPPIPPPPVRIYARQGQRITHIGVPREVLRVRFPEGRASESADGTDFEGSEEERSTEDVVIADPNDPSVTVTVQRAQKITFIDDNGRRLKLRMAQAI